MKWTELVVHTTNEAVEPVANILHEHGASGVAIEDSIEVTAKRESMYGETFELNPADYPETGVYVKAYLSENDATNDNIEKIKHHITELGQIGIDIGPNVVTYSEVKEESWATAWKQYYKPIPITERITVVPEWEEYTKTKQDEIVVWMDPGMAFGTGTHPTTILSAVALDAYLKPNDVVIDVGSGSGILSIISALLGVKEVHAFDLDDVAVESTKNNIALNKVDSPIYVNQNDLLKDVDLKADVIVANILAEVIVKFVRDAYNCLKDDGLFITSGIIHTKQQMIEDALQENGFSIVKVNEMDDWVSIIAKR